MSATELSGCVQEPGLKEVTIMQVFDTYFLRFGRALVKCALNHLNKPPMVKQIEARRHEMLARDEMLVDDAESLGPGGLYDQDVSVARAARVSKSPPAALMLYHLVREFKPKKLIELGTNVGVSSAYLGAAVKQNGGGSLITLEASPYRLQLAKDLCADLELPISYVQGLFSDTLGPTLEEFGKVDFAFIDGHHQYEPTWEYYRQISEFAEPNAVFLFDDITWSDGMKQAWAEIRVDSKIRYSITLKTMGAAILK